MASFLVEKYFYVLDELGGKLWLLYTFTASILNIVTKTQTFKLVVSNVYF